VADVFSCDQEALWDLIFCRNLMIYLENRSALNVWDRLFRALRPHGIMVTGKAEKPPAGRGWRCVCPCIYRKEELT
jgi:chemotaxis methyl-accepting protein methylase